MYAFPKLQYALPSPTLQSKETQKVKLWSKIYYPECRLCSQCGGAKRRRKFPVESVQRRPILCLQSQILCGTICDWLHDLTFVLTCVQRVLLVTNFRIMFVTGHIRWTEVRPIVKSCSQSKTIPQKSEKSKYRIGCRCKDSTGSFLLLFTPPHWL